MKKAKDAKTQSRSLESQQAVIDSVVALINEKGFSNATTKNISKQAGLSWGVLQYQFGSKEAIFTAVLENNIERLRQKVGHSLDTASHQDPIETMINTLWEHFASASYRAAIEILMNQAHSDDFEEFIFRAQREIRSFCKNAYKSAGYRNAPKKWELISDVTISALRGFAINNAIVPELADDFVKQRALLVESTHQLLDNQAQ